MQERAEVGLEVLKGTVTVINNIDAVFTAISYIEYCIGNTSKRC